MIAEIEQRDHLLQTVNQAVDILLRSEPQNFSNTLYLCMGMMANAIDADRMYLFKNHMKNGKRCCTQLYEWSEKAEPFQDTEIRTDVFYEETMPETEKILARGECVHILVRDMPASNQEQCRAMGILAILGDTRHSARSGMDTK